MSAMIVLNNKASRDYASKQVYNCPLGTRIEFKGPKRSLPQNDRMWAMLTDIAKQKPGGREYPVAIWKCLMMHACGREVIFLPSLDKNSMVPIAYNSSELSKSEMSDLIEFMYAWGAENGVIFNEEIPT